MVIITSNTLKLYTTGEGWLRLSVPENYIPSGSLNVAIPIDTDIQCTLQATSITSDSSDNLYVSGTVSEGSYTGSVTFIYNPTLATTDIIAANILDGETLLLSIGNNIPAFDQMLIHDKKLYAGGSIQAGTLALYSYDGTTWLPLTETVTSSINKLFATNSTPTAVLRSPVVVPPTYSADTVFYLESASIVSATHPRKQLIEETITALKNGGLWDKLDMMFIKGNPFDALPFCDIKRGSYVGYNDVNTAFVPDLDAVNMTLSSASIGVYSAAIPTTRTPSTIYANFIASLNRSDMYGDWQPITTGTNGSVLKIITNGSDVYVAGNFTTAGGVTVGRIAKWNGSVWSALGSGTTSSSISDITMDSLGNLYACGTFTSICGVSANRIAKWNGSTWSALGTGLAGGTGTIAGNCLTVDSTDNLYVGGRFTTAGGVSANRIAKWNGSVWSALGTGYSGGSNTTAGIYGIAVDSLDNVYAGGDHEMTSIGGVSANSIAKWNGSTWSALGTGLSHSTPSTTLATAITVDKTTDTVYVGGRFTTAGGTIVNNFAAWNGTTWSSMGSGIPSQANDVSLSSTNVLFVAGTSGVYEWTGVDWNFLGGGSNTVACGVGEVIYTGGSLSSLSLMHNIGCYVGVSSSASLLLSIDIDTGTLLAKVNSDTYTSSPISTATTGLLTCTTNAGTQEIWANGVSVASSVVTPTSLPSAELYNLRENIGNNFKLINTSNYAVFAGAYLSGAEQLTLKAILENYFNTTTYQ